jgi:hypothetical protein
MAKKKFYFFIFAVCMAGYVWVILNTFYYSSIHIGCLFHKITHIPCPACGSTRSVLSLLNGDFSNAFYANPFGYIICISMIILPLWILFDWISQKDSFIRAYKNIESLFKRKYIAAPAIVLVLINWIWNIFKYT